MTGSDELNDLQKKLKELDGERQTILSAIARIQVQETKPSAPPSLLGSCPSTKSPETPEEKIALFLELFKTRGDVFPLWWDQPFEVNRALKPLVGKNGSS